jgi:hypothetical protein
MTLVRLDDLCRVHLKLSTKNTVPEAARDTEAVLVVRKVVREVVLLQLLVVLGKPSKVSKALDGQPCGTYFW